MAKVQIMYFSWLTSCFSQENLLIIFGFYSVSSSIKKSQTFHSLQVVTSILLVFTALRNRTLIADHSFQEYAWFLLSITLGSLAATNIALIVLAIRLIFLILLSLTMNRIQIVQKSTFLSLNCLNSPPFIRS